MPEREDFYVTCPRLECLPLEYAVSAVAQMLRMASRCFFPLS
jgi:hypothetical protein